MGVSRAKQNIDKLKPDEIFKEVPSKGGRPTICSEELIDKLCEVIAHTPKSINTIIDENPWMPAAQTIGRWHATNPSFRDRYIQAKKEQVARHVQHTFEITDAISEEVKFEDPKIANALVAAAKLKCDVRQWYAGKIAPKIYGDKSDDDDKDTTKDEPKTESQIIDEIRNVLGEATKRDGGK